MVDKEAVRRGYDEMAEIYAEDRSESGDGLDILAEFLDSFTDLDLILDAGCGQGVPVLRELHTAATGLGIDFSRRQLDLATENVPRANLVQGDITRLPIRDNTVDAVTAYHSLIHIPLDEHQTVVDEFARILRPNGRVLLSEGPDAWTGTNPDWLDSGVEMQWHIAGVETTRKQLQNAGFAIENEWETGETGEEWMFLSAQLDS